MRWLRHSEVRDDILIPKYYDPQLEADTRDLASTHHLFCMRDLLRSKSVAAATGKELGKAAYGTGEIPFVRTSDISNWEVKALAKQGVADSYYTEFSDQMDVQPGDVLMVRDGTYLIGTNCIVSEVDGRLLYQSHILKFRVAPQAPLTATEFFGSLNCPLVQRQIRSKQFTADIIDTIGQRHLELVLPVRRDGEGRSQVTAELDHLLSTRSRGKAMVKQFPTLMEQALLSGSMTPVAEFSALSPAEMARQLEHRTVRAEFGSFTARWAAPEEIRHDVLLPKYYDATIDEELQRLSAHCELISIGKLISNGSIEYATGDEIGKMAYGTGDVPFLRTSDFSAWEVKHDPKQGVSNEIYEQYRAKQDLQPCDILIVRDGTYLVGQSCMVTATDARSLYCGGLIKLRATGRAQFDSFCLLGLLNAFITKRQIRARQFTRDVIDTLGQRLREVVLPVPRNAAMRQGISETVRSVVASRIESRVRIGEIVSNW